MWPPAMMGGIGGPKGVQSIGTKVVAAGSSSAGGGSKESLGRIQRRFGRIGAVVVFEQARAWPG